jgi:hypothetical protein
LGNKGSPDGLQGNTLRVYWVMLQNSKNSVGPRDIQRKLGFSSPNLAVYHLDKLVELGLAEKKLGEYYLSDKVNVGLFKQFTKIGSYIFPRQVLYASLWSTLFAFLIFTFRDLNFYSLFAFVFGLLGLIIFWFEAWKSWESMPH